MPLHVPLAPLAPEPDSSGMLPFMCPCMCPWLCWLRAKSLQDVPLHVPRGAPPEPGLIAPRYARLLLMLMLMLMLTLMLIVIRL